MRRCNSVASCHLMAGEHDYMLQVKVASMADYERLHQQELSRFPVVSRLESNFAVRDVIEREIGI
nr:Lrp/AsnC ligand binding domain-containing protein [Granulicella rosea]